MEYFQKNEFYLEIETFSQPNLIQKVIYWGKINEKKKYGVIKLLFGPDISNMYDTGNTKDFLNMWFLESFHRFDGKKGDGEIILKIFKNFFPCSLFVFTKNKKLLEYYQKIGFTKSIYKNIPFFQGTFEFLIFN